MNRLLTAVSAVWLIVSGAAVAHGQTPLPHNVPFCPGGGTTVAQGTTLTAVTGQSFDCVQVEAGAIFRVPAGVSIRVTTVLALPGSTYEQAGEVIIRDVTPADAEAYQTGLLLLGNVFIHGQALTSFTRLAAELRAGQTLQAVAVAQNWRPSSVLLVPDTRHLRQSEIGPGFLLQAETVTAATPLRYDHLGARDEHGQLEFLPHVANLTRTCRVRSENPAGTRGHVLITGTGTVEVSYCAFEDLGRTTTAPTGPGNQIGRYPLHFHHFRGMTGLPAGIPQFTVLGNAIYQTRRLAGTYKPKNGLVIHDSHFGVIRDNVVYRLDGTGFWTEDGSETENLFDHNFCVDVQGIGPRDAGATEGVCFYSRGPNSRWTNNVAANAYQPGVNESAYGFKLFQQYVGTIRVPRFPGADTADNTQVVSVSAYTLPVREFRNNEVYASSNGMTYWWVGAEWRTPKGAPVTRFQHTVIWHVHNIGVFHYESSNVTHDGLTIRGLGPTSSAACCGVGVRMQDYFAQDFVLQHADIQGLADGLQLSTDGGPQLIEDSYLSNDANIVRRTLWSSNAAAGIPPRQVVVRNVRFGSGQPLRSHFDVPAGPRNYIQTDIFQVQAFDGVAGDDFDLFWLQQAPGFTVPVSGQGNVGAPVAGLTNQQASAQYGLAVAGSIAPCSVTRAGVDGFTCSSGSAPMPNWVPPPPTSPAPAPAPTPGPSNPPAGTVAQPETAPSPGTSSASGCLTPDPFVALGGGTCAFGNWYPPGMTVPGSTSGVTPAPSTPPPPAPPSAGGCATPDPFVALGGGTCYQGNWYPPGMPVPGGGSSSWTSSSSSGTTSTTTTTTTQPALYGGSCTTADPFTVLGGGTCHLGKWYPPGMSIPGTSTPAATPSSEAGSSGTSSSGGTTTTTSGTTSSGGTTSGSTTTSSGTTTAIGSVGTSSGPPVQTGAKMLLSPGDFSYLGYYDVVTDGWDTEHLQGLTHRYVNGDLRFLTLDLTGRLTEFSLTGRNFGDLVNQVTQTWSQPWGTSKTLHGSFFGLWWDEAGQRLWTTHATDYNANSEQVQIYTRTLNSNGTISNLRGPVGLQGLHAKRVYGGCQPVPQWFQAQYGVPPYACGWGGYTSILTVGSSMGFAMYAVPDPAGYANGADIPATQFKVMADHAAGSTRNDWYASGAPTTLDRGRRLTHPINYFDGGDNRPNGTCTGCTSDTPTNPPLSTAQWLSPAPDSFGRWVWGDSYYNTGIWIDSPAKTGFLAIASLGAGKTWYCTSICTERREFELHIFDPADLGQVVQGQMRPYNLQPKLMAQLTLPGLGGGQRVSNPRRNIAGATFDPTTNRLYLISGGAVPHAARIYVFQVVTQ